MTNQVLETIKTRRSIRAFTDRNISREDLELLTEAARYAPSGLNRQTWKFTVVQRPELLKKLARTGIEAEFSGMKLELTAVRITAFIMPMR